MGRPVTDIERQHVISKLAPQHRAMARAMAEGARPTDLCEAFGYTPTWVSQITNSPLFRAEVARLTGKIEQSAQQTRREIEAELDALLSRSVEVIATELHNPKASARRTETAFKILDRRGYHPRSDVSQTDKRQFNFITLAPMPGENPDAALKRVNSVVKQLANGMEPEDRANLPLVTEWPEGDYVLQKKSVSEGRHVYQLQCIEDY